MQVSVIIATYNSQDYIEECLGSVLDQNFDDFECIVVDDGSADGTSQIVKSIKDKRLKFFSLPVNCGIATARNIGFKMSSGNYLAVMDSDDVCFPNRLIRQFDCLESHKEIDILGSRTVRVRKSLSSIIDRPLHPLDDSIIKSNMLLLNGTAMVHPSSMMRRTFLEENKLMYLPRTMDVDHAFWIKSISVGARFACLEEELIYKRRHDKNVTFINASTKEAAKTPLRSELLGLYYPSLSVKHVWDLALLMEKNRELSPNQIQEGILAGNQALLDKKSYYGESKMHLAKILAFYLRQASQSLRGGS